MRPSPRTTFVLWLLAMITGALVIAHSHFVADLSFVLPAHPSPEQRLLVSEMTEGGASRVLMMAIDGGSEAQRAQASKALRGTLAASGLFVSVQNGEIDALGAERDFLLRWRYLLSPAVNPGRFTVAGLRDAIDNTIALASSPMGQLFKPYLLQDPTGELLQILTSLQGGDQPPVRDGVWMSPGGQRALLLAQTRVAGSDTDGQAQAMAAARTAFAKLQRTQDAPALRLILSGPGVFAVDSRDAISQQVSRTSLLGLLGILLVLGWVYRSLRTLALGVLPVITGAVAGLVVVALVAGSVHGITVGFGTALIGEAVDYATYFCLQSGHVGVAAWRRDFWPTIRLGVLTSVVGFGALVWAGFPGLAQLGLYALSGVLTAALVTRFVLPALAGTRGVTVAPPGVIARRSQALLPYLPVLRWPLLLLAAAALIYLLAQRGALWSTDLSALSTINAAQSRVDERLRADLGAPDARYLVLVRAPRQEQALEWAEDAAVRLQALVRQGVIGGFETPTRFLPSERAQAARRAALPVADVLRARLAQALAGAPLSPARLQPFVDAVEAACAGPLLRRADLSGTALALAVDALMSEHDGVWNIVMPLRPSATAHDGGIPVAAVRHALAGSAAVVVDLKGEFELMYDSYLHQAWWLSLGGVAGIVILLAFSLRSWRRLARVMLTLAVTVVLVFAGLHAFGRQLNLLHLVGLLLIVAVGSNYALFFDRISEDRKLSGDVWVSISVAVLTTAIGFGVLAFSSIPVLEAMGSTVAPGVLLAMLVSAAFMGGRRGESQWSA